VTQPTGLSDPEITHVSDTALWVAVYRAMETKRKDAVFRDPYAERLAGERGVEIVKRLESGRSTAWSVITRTAVLDEMILQSIQQGTDVVLNLAAGLDTRPYRLTLPGTLRWIEVDFPEILAYKESKLADAHPRCALERVSLDLSRRGERQALFTRINSESRDVLVLTEGLLVYLTQEQVAALAEDLHAMAHFRRWIADVLTPELLAWLLETSFKRFATGSVQMHFAPPGGATFFERYGWGAQTVRAVTEESRRLKRQMPRAWLFRILGALAPKHVRERYSKFDSYFLALQRS
jgi:methyltransferase (TIGR00027 family)